MIGWPALAVVPAVVLAQAIPEPYGIFAQFGVAGLCGFLLYRRYESELAHERAARERAEAQADALAERVISDLAPLVARVGTTVVPALDRLSTEVARMGERLDRIERG